MKHIWFRAEQPEGGIVSVTGYALVSPEELSIPE